MTPILELKGITKRFPGVLANDHIDLSLNKGEILALLGENGAGKSTLMNILYGLYQPDEGEILVDGQKVTINSPTDAINQGIGMVHQHFMLIPVFTVTENVMLGNEAVKKAGFLDRKKAADHILEISNHYNLEVNPDDYIRDLPVGVQQRVEIIKLLYREAEILIFDEPTAVLTPQEADELFKIMRSLVAQGKSIIFITHKLREVMDIADRVMVIRRGAMVGETTPAQADKQSLAAMMVGRAVDLEVDRTESKPGELVCSVENLTVADKFQNIVVDDVSLEVFAGEIVGIAGVQGNGQTELVNAVTGLQKALSGKIMLFGEDVTKSSPRQITELGSAHVPEDRQADGLVLPFPVAENLVLCTYYKEPFAKGVLLQYPVILKNAEKLIQDFDIRTPNAFTSVESLSGGNQQKVMIGRWLCAGVDTLLVEQPTRGVDVGAKAEIYGLLRDFAKQGGAVLALSSDLLELIGLCDRILMVSGGQIAGDVPAANATEEQLLALALIQPVAVRQEMQEASHA